MSHKQYEKLERTGDNFIPSIPAHWQLMPLKYLVSGTRKITYGIVQAGPHQERGIPYVRPADMSEEKGIVDPENILRTSEKIAREYSRSSLKEGDIVCSIGPSFGKVMLTPKWLEGGNLTQGTARIATDPRTDSNFIFWSLRSYTSKHQWESAIGGATFRALNLGPLSETSIAVPPIKEQVLIGEFLDRETAKIDSLITEQERLIELLQEKRQAVISQAVTKGLNSNAPMKDSGVEWLGEVPEHWEIKKIKYLGKVQNGSTPHKDNSEYWENGSFPWMTSTAVNQDQIYEPQNWVTEQALKECTLPIIKPPAVLIGITGQGKTRGMAGTLHVETTINQHVASITPHDTSVEIDFLRASVDSMYKFLRRDSDAGGATKGAITCKELENYSICKPRKEEQREITAWLSKQLGLIKQLSQSARDSIDLMQERRSALISAAVTGQIDVRGLVPGEEIA